MTTAVMPKHHIMIVDDESDIREALELLLSTMDYRVSCVADGQACLEWLSQNYKDLPHAIVLDVRMPGMNGAQVAQKLKSTERTRHIPIIMLTGLDDPKYRRAALLELKVEYYLTKPFDPDLLLEKIETAVKYRVRP